MGRENKTYEQVKSEIEKREHGEVERYQKLYGMDYKNPTNYDLVIDTSFLTPEEIIEKILEKLSR